MTQMKFLIAFAIGSLLLLVVQSVEAHNRRPKGKRPGKQQQRPGDLRMPDRLKVGMAAPDFKLKTKDGKRDVRLSSFKGKRPVVLVFGSYT